MLRRRIKYTGQVNEEICYLVILKEGFQYIQVQLY